MKRKVICISIAEGMIPELDKISKLQNVSRSRYIENLLFKSLIHDSLENNYTYEEDPDVE